MAISPTLSVMEKAIRRASRSLLRDYGEIEQLQSSIKNNDRFVEVASSKAEKELMLDLNRAKPEFGIIADGVEKKKADGACSYYWIVKGLDGAGNFLHALPFFSINVTFAEKHGKGFNELAVYIELPCYRESYWAEKKGGSYARLPVNNDALSKLKVSGRKSLEDITIATHLDDDNLATLYRKFKPNQILNLGSTGLVQAFVASGKCDVGVTKNTYINLLTKEAFGACQDVGACGIIGNELLVKEFEGII